MFVPVVTACILKEERVLKEIKNILWFLGFAELGDELRDCNCGQSTTVPAAFRIQRVIMGRRHALKQLAVESWIIRYDEQHRLGRLRDALHATGVGRKIMEEERWYETPEGEKDG